MNYEALTERIMSLPDHEFYREIHLAMCDDYNDYLMKGDNGKEVWQRLTVYHQHNGLKYNPYFEKEKPSWRNLFGLFAGYRLKEK